MQIEQFKETGAIYLDKIQDGFDRCDWEELTLPAGKALERLLEEWRHCGEENAWADFYYFTLPKEAKEKIRNMLSAEELAFLAKLGKKADGVFFPLKEELRHLLLKLNDSEMLFSTVYFTNPKSTWWGNYGRTYIVFREKDHK